MEYYNWQKTLSYSAASAYVVIGAKGIGKTFSCRMLCLDDYLKNGNRFVEISRYQDESDDVCQGYFDKLALLPKYKNYLFKTDSKCGYIAPTPDIDEDGNEMPPEWELVCYFVALSTFQKQKKKTFVNVRSIIFDEFIIDARDRYHRYLPDEWGILNNIMDSILRENPSEKSNKRLFMLANACDLSCPYFETLGINKIPNKFGYRYYKNKAVLLHYVEPINAEELLTKTLVGRMLQGSKDTEMVYYNLFSDSDGRGFIEKRSKAASLWCGLYFQNQIFNIYFDKNNGRVYVDRNKHKNTTRPVYTFVSRDGSIDFIALKRSEKICKTIIDLHYRGVLRFDNVITRELFISFLKFLGVV